MKTIIAVLLIAALVTPYALMQNAAQAQSVTLNFSGRAIGVSLDTATADLKIADSGELSPSGGRNYVVGQDAANELVQALGLVSYTSGFDHRAQSEVALARIALLPGTLNEITAGFVGATSTATCESPGNLQLSGSTEIVNLSLAGQSIAVSGVPNQTVSIPSALTMIINEQIQGANEITVNALHLILATGEEIIVGSARSGITCPIVTTAISPLKSTLTSAQRTIIQPTWHEQGLTPRDFTTGGGWFGYVVVVDPKASFGFVAGYKPNTDTEVEGELSYHDHGTDMRVKSGNAAGQNDVYAYWGSGNTRNFCGDAQVNGNPGFGYCATAIDNGEGNKGPKAENPDEFHITVWGPNFGYRNGGKMGGDTNPADGKPDGGGNIQIHYDKGHVA